MPDEVLMVIVSSATSEVGFGLTGLLQKLGISPIDYETCNDLCDGDIVDSVMLYADVPGMVKIVAKATGSGGRNTFRELRCRKDWIDATICELSSNHPAFLLGQTDRNIGDDRYSEIMLVLWSLTGPPAAQVPPVVLPPRLCCDRSQGGPVHRQLRH
jgi:hypothetical protein